MNELHAAYSIRSALDEGAETLPYRISERLAQARRQALAEMPAEGVHGFATMPAHQARPSVRTAACQWASRQNADRPSLFARLALTVAPIMLVVAGLITIAQLKDEQQVQEMAELDAAVIMDTVPISAYADPGFGVFLKNNRQ